MSIMQWQIPTELDVLSIAGYPLSYFQVGRGDPLILVHGSLNDYRSWQAQIPDLAQRYRVLAPSLRHYYPELWDGKDGDFSLARHAADIIELIRSLRLAPVHLAGHSRGGSVAYLVARDAPELVRSLVLAEPRGLEDLLSLDATQAEGARSSDAIFLVLHENLKAGCKEIAAEAFVDAFNGAGSWAAMPASQKTIILDNIGTSVDTGELPGMRCEDIARFDMPVLLVRGEKSLSRYALGFEAMRACNPMIGEVAVVPRAPHGMHRVNPEAFNAIVTKFLAGVA
jgi:esterase